MLYIRDYRPEDAPAAGRLIADTYAQFNLAFAEPGLRDLMLGPFLHANSTDVAHQAAIAAVVQSPICYVAVAGDRVVGILRGRDERLASLFVHREFQQRGIGRQLVTRFEAAMAARRVGVIRVAATLYAVPFYAKLGYRRSTGLRLGWSFAARGLPYQPMKKVLLPFSPERSV